MSQKPPRPKPPNRKSFAWTPLAPIVESKEGPLDREYQAEAARQYAALIVKMTNKYWPRKQINVPPTRHDEYLPSISDVMARANDMNKIDIDEYMGSGPMMGSLKYKKYSPPAKGKSELEEPSREMPPQIETGETSAVPDDVPAEKEKVDPPSCPLANLSRTPNPKPEELNTAISDFDPDQDIDDIGEDSLPELNDLEKEHLILQEKRRRCRDSLLRTMEGRVEKTSLLKRKYMEEYRLKVELKIKKAQEEKAWFAG